MSIKFQGRTIAGNTVVGVMDKQMYHAKLQSDGRTYIVQEDLEFAINEVRFIHFDKTNTVANPIVKYGWISPNKPGLYSKELIDWASGTVKEYVIPNNSLLNIALVDNNVDKLQLTFIDLVSKASVDDKVEDITVNNEQIVYTKKNIAPIAVDINGFITDVEYDPIDGKLTFSKKGNPDVVIDLPLELIIAKEGSRYNNDDKQLELLLANGDIIVIPVGDLIVDLNERMTNAEYKLNGIESGANKYTHPSTHSVDIIVETPTKQFISLGERTKLADIPTPADILTKDKYTMKDGYAPTQPKHLTDKDYVDKTVQGITGQNPANWITREQLDVEMNSVKAELNEPSFINLTLTEPVNHITDNILDSPNEIISIQGKSEVKVKQSELDIANLKVNDTIKNELIYTNGQATISEKVGKVTVDNKMNWSYYKETTNYIAFSSYGAFYNDNISNIYNTPIANNLFPIFDGALVSTYNNEGVALRSGSLYVFILKSKIVGYNEGLTNVEKRELFKIWLQNQATANNPLTVTYQLAVQNPKEKIIQDSDVSGITPLTNIDLITINKPVDAIMYNNITLKNVVLLDGFTEYVGNNSEIDNISNINKFYTFNNNTLFFLITTKGTTLQQAKDLLRNKKLTYQLATPRFALTDGIPDVVNPKVVSVGKNLFDNTNLLQGNIIDNGTVVVDNTIVYTNDLLSINTSKKYTYKCYQQINGNDIVINRVVEYDSNKKFLRRLNIGLTSTITYTPSVDTRYIRLLLRFPTLSALTPNQISSIQIMFNEGITALPYEPYQNTQTSFNETIGSIPNTSITDEIKPLANGLFEVTKKVKTVKLLEQTFISATHLTNFYRFSITNFRLNNSLKTTGLSFNGSISFINTFTYDVNAGSEVRGYYYNNDFVISIEKSTIDKIKTDYALATLELACKKYCELYNITFKGELATYDKKIASATYLEDLVINKGSTIYLDGEAVTPVVKLQCALDISAQVSKTIGDSRINDNEHQLFKTDISNIDTRVKTIEAITDVTPYVDETNKGKSGYLSPQDKAKLNKLNEANVVQGIKLSDSTTPLNLDSNKVATIPLADTNKDGLMSKSTVSQITEHEQKISALQGTVIYRGIISVNNNDVSQTILNNYITTTLKRNAQVGDTLIDGDNHEWYFDGTKWNDWGISIIGVASDNSVGIVQLGYTEDKTKIPVKIVNNRVYVDITDSAISHALGDLSKAIIKGVKVDNATNADKLGNQLYTYYATKGSVDNIINGTTKVGKSGDAETLGGQLPSYYIQNIPHVVEVIDDSLQNGVPSTVAVHNFVNEEIQNLHNAFNNSIESVNNNFTPINNNITNLKNIVDYHWVQLRSGVSSLNIGKSQGDSKTITVEQINRFTHIAVEWASNDSYGRQIAIAKRRASGEKMFFTGLSYNEVGESFTTFGFTATDNVNSITFYFPKSSPSFGAITNVLNFNIYGIYGLNGTSTTSRFGTTEGGQGA